MEELNIRIECDDCGASYIINHSMDDDRYKVDCCSFCGSGYNIEIESIKIDQDDED